MDCPEVATLLLDRRRGRLTPEVAAAVDAHLKECETCRLEDAADDALSVALGRLPAPTPRLAFKKDLRSRYASGPVAKETRFRRVLLGVAACAVWVAVVAMRHRPREPDAMVVEAVNDHLRLLYSEHPIEIESGGVHQVKPWFAGRLDFAPTIGFGGDDDYPLQGGAVAYFMDRKAAAYEFKRRLHPITLLVFQADGLPWPKSANPFGPPHTPAATTRGFHVFLWREGDLGYALVSDVDERDLAVLESRFAVR